MPFIDFIVCPAYQFAYKDEVLREYGLSSTKYRTGHYSPTINDSTNIDLEFIFDTITYRPNEILKKIKITTKDRQQRNFLQNFKEGDIEMENLEIITKYQNNLGRCFSIRPKDHVVSLEVIKIDITASMDVYVYIGYPGQFMYNTKERVRFHNFYKFLFTILWYGRLLVKHFVVIFQWFCIYFSTILGNNSLRTKSLS